MDVHQYAGFARQQHTGLYFTQYLQPAGSALLAGMFRVRWPGECLILLFEIGNDNRVKHDTHVIMPNDKIDDNYELENLITWKMKTINMNARVTVIIID